MIKWLIKKIEKEILKDINEDISKKISEYIRTEYQVLHSEWDELRKQRHFLNSEGILDGLVLRLKKKQLKG